jgi:hypothetical protein
MESVCVLENKTEGNEVNQGPFLRSLSVKIPSRLSCNPTVPRRSFSEDGLKNVPMLEEGVEAG